MNNSDQVKTVFRYYWRHARKSPRLIAAILAATPAAALANHLIPNLIMADILSRLSSGRFTPNDIWGSFGWELVAYGLIIMTGILCWRFIDRFTWKLEANTLHSIQHEVFDGMIAKSANFHANHFSGSLVSNNNKLLSGYIRIADSFIFQILPMTASIILAVIILSTRAPLFAGLLVVFAIVFIFIAFKISKPVRKVGRKHSQAESRTTGFLADAISNVMVIKSFARGNYERSRYRESTDETQHKLFAVARKAAFQLNVLGFMTRTISLVSVISAVISVMIFHADIGTVFLILTYTMTIVDNLFSFGNQTLRGLNRAVGDSSDMITILAEPPEVTDPVKPEPLRISSGDIHLKNVTFKHNGADDAIFDKLNITIKHGEKVGLVGHSGSGKTTFTRVLLRFSDIDDGEILIDGQNIAHITQDDLHSKIAYVPQEPLLFHRTIAENIAYGNPEASQHDIEVVSKQAHAHGFIQALPTGYDTLVGERGVKLSGGQRQRIAIARAMLKDSPILVLDEATSALDSESEVLIQDALWKLMQNRTAIVIAHRLSTIQHMDRIVVLDNGRIIEEGTHKQLIKSGKTYAKLWAHQSGGFIED